MFHDFEYTVAPPYSGPYWQLGYKTRNATLNANSLNTLIFLPYLLTALYVFFQLLKKIGPKCGFFSRVWCNKETLQALWIRISLIIFMPVCLIALQMHLPSKAYP